MERAGHAGDGGAGGRPGELLGEGAHRRRRRPAGRDPQPPRDYHAWLNAGALLPLDDRLKKERQNVPDLLPTALEYWNRDGKLWALPYNLSVQNLYFNRDLFARQGLKTPSSTRRKAPGPGRPTSTWPGA